MDLVIDDEAPVASVEEFQMREVAVPSRGHDLVRRDGDRADLLHGAGVLTDLILGEGRALEEFVLPLPRAHRVGHEDQRCRPSVGHGGSADDRLACAAGEYDHTGSAVPEGFGRLALVVAKGPTLFLQVDVVGFAVDVAGQILGRPPQLQQRLLEIAALAGVYDDSVIVDACPDHARDLLGAEYLFEHRTIGGHQDQSVDGVLLQPQAAEAGNRLGDVDEHGVGHGVARVLQQGVDDLLGVVPRSPSVPEPQRRQAVGMNVLR